MDASNGVRLAREKKEQIVHAMTLQYTIAAPIECFSTLIAQIQRVYKWNRRSITTKRTAFKTGDGATFCFCFLLHRESMKLIYEILANIKTKAKL